MKNIILVVKLTIKEQYVEEIKKEILELHKLTKQNDKGCIQYDLHEIKDDKNSLMLIETWENETSLEEHKQKDHFTNFMKLIKGKVELKVDFLEKITE